MNKRRLLKLADLLEADAKNKTGVRFDLTAWAKGRVADDDYDDDFSVYAFKPRQKVTVNCNTAACAWGLAAISGVFARQGVGYRIKDSRLVPTYKRETEFEAAQAFFGITDLQSFFLFDPDSYNGDQRFGARGERYVAKRIRDFVAGKVYPDTAVSP